MTSRRLRTFSTLLALAILLVLAPPQASTQFQTTPTTFSGQATAVKGTILGMPITLADTGPSTLAGVSSRRTCCAPQMDRIVW